MATYLPVVVVPGTGTGTGVLYWYWGTGTGTGTKMRCTLTHMYHTNRHRIGNSTVQQLHVRCTVQITGYSTVCIHM